MVCFLLGKYLGLERQVTGCVCLDFVGPATPFPNMSPPYRSTAYRICAVHLDSFGYQVWGVPQAGFIWAFPGGLLVPSIACLFGSVSP